MANPTGIERRRLKRVVKRVPVIFVCGPLNGEAHIGNLSKGGLYLRTDVLPPQGARVQVLIKPHDSNHKIVGELVFQSDRLLTDMLPHMHLRGKSYRYVAVYPDGKEEILLDVPRYDFNWQLRYELVKPKLMPKGTTLRGIAYYDNSEDNLANPDPSETVRYGDQTWEEMMHGFFSTIPVEKRKPKN